MTGPTKYVTMGSTMTHGLTDPDAWMEQVDEMDMGCDDPRWNEIFALVKLAQDTDYVYETGQLCAILGQLRTRLHALHENP